MFAHRLICSVVFALCSLERPDKTRELTAKAAEKCFFQPGGGLGLRGASKIMALSLGATFADFFGRGVAANLSRFHCVFCILGRDSGDYVLCLFWSSAARLGFLFSASGRASADSVLGLRPRA